MASTLNYITTTNLDVFYPHFVYQTNANQLKLAKVGGKNYTKFKIFFTNKTPDRCGMQLSSFPFILIHQNKTSPLVSKDIQKLLNVTSVWKQMLCVGPRGFLDNIREQSASWRLRNIADRLGSSLLRKEWGSTGNLPRDDHRLNMEPEWGEHKPGRRTRGAWSLWRSCRAT